MTTKKLGVIGGILTGLGFAVEVVKGIIDAKQSKIEMQAAVKQEVNDQLVSLLASVSEETEEDEDNE